VGLPTYFVNFDHNPNATTIYSFVLQLSLWLFSASLAWIAGKKYSINYIIVCCLAFWGVSVFLVIKSIKFLSVSGETITMDILKDELSLIIPTIIFIPILFGIAVLIISYPIQIIFLKFFSSKEIS
jgi:hypothetical protein